MWVYVWVWVCECEYVCVWPRGGRRRGGNGVRTCYAVITHLLYLFCLLSLSIRLCNKYLWWRFFLLLLTGFRSLARLLSCLFYLLLVLYLLLSVCSNLNTYITICTARMMYYTYFLAAHLNMYREVFRWNLYYLLSRMFAEVDGTGWMIAPFAK